MGRKKGRGRRRRSGRKRKDRKRKYSQVQLKKIEFHPKKGSWDVRQHKL